MDDDSDISEYLKGLYNYQIELLFKVLYDGDDESVDTLNKVGLGLLEAWKDEISTNEGE